MSRRRRRLNNRPAPPKRSWPIFAAGAVAAALIAAVWVVAAGRGTTAANRLEEAEAHLAAGRAARAERALREAAAAAPGNLRARVLLLEILRVEDRRLEAMNLGFEALGRVALGDRPAILRQITLAALIDVADATARAALNRWIAADPTDFQAETALLKRIGADPRADDPDRAARIERLEAIVADHPDAPNPREALLLALADAGEAERGRAILDAWPAAARDARYQRLLGRWELDYDRRPQRAVAAFQLALKELPQDWPTHYRLARALTILGRDEEARRAAETVARIREALDPGALATLDAAKPEPLAAVCRRVGLERLAREWRAVAGAGAKP